MIYLVSLLVAVLVSLQCSIQVTAQVNDKINLEKNIKTNVIGTPRRLTNIRKHVRIWSAPEETTRHQPGTTTELECVVMGKPAPSVQWLRNGEPLADIYDEEGNDIASTDPSSVGQLTSKLLLKSVTSGDVYTCVATSGVKQTSASTTVYNVEDAEEQPMTLEKLLYKPLKPIITSFYDTMFQNEGTEVLLPCTVAANSNTNTQVFWQDKHKNLVYGDSRRQMLPSGALLIKDLRWDEDMGELTCTAKNIYGKESRSLFLYPIILKPRMA